MAVRFDNPSSAVKNSQPIFVYFRYIILMGYETTFLKNRLRYDFAICVYPSMSYKINYIEPTSCKISI